MTDEQAVPTFEKQLETLEALITRMESQSLSLSASMAAFQEAMALTQACQKTLEEAQAQITVWEEHAASEPKADDPSHAQE